MNSNEFSQLVTVFHGRMAPEEGYLVGYGALINYLNMAVPLPDRLALISQKRKQYETEEWLVFTPRHQPKPTVIAHITFALKYEGVDLYILKKLFEKIEEKDWVNWISEEPTGQYSRRTWFFYEWLMNKKLPIPDLIVGNYIDVIDDTLQYGATSETSKRHRVKNNLPGTREFCPLVRKTKTLEHFIDLQLSKKIEKIIGKIHPDIIARTAAFLLLKDSKASYAIEGENPLQNRAIRWGKAIGEAGQKPISKDELIRLQQLVIDNPRFTKMGWRKEGGFVGEHDRNLGTPLPEHISAKWQDLPFLLEGLINTTKKLEKENEFDAVIAAATIAFGFVFIHPFVDGNGRIHRYLIHHTLTSKGYVTPGIIFPVSAIILERINEYRKVLEAFSLPRIELIEWKQTADNNVEVLNETADLYRYFDATKQAEFLYSCVQQTIDKTIPDEVEYLERYDNMKAFLDNQFEMPDRMVAMLVRFLQQGKGKLSDRAKEKEFAALKSEEVSAIEIKYAEIFEI